MSPKHIKKVQDDRRRAVAPYNFVELPDQVVEAEPLPAQNVYCQNRHTGRIECTLTTESPLYIRCGMTTDEFKSGKESKDLPEFFYTDSSNKSKKPVIPGSSLRGMLRTLVEICSFGKIDRVSGEKHFFFRAVAADKDDPLKEEYEKYIKPQNIKAGYLVEKQGAWFIRPAMLIDGKYTFVWVKEDKVKSIPKFIPMNNLKDYKPQYLINISFEDIFTKNGRNFAKKVSNQCTTYKYQGVLLTSGNMLEGSTNQNNLKRKNHCIIREPDSNAKLIPISENAIKNYCSALTPFQKKEPFSEDKGVLKHGRCIFYCQPESGQPVTLFGQSPNFRIPYFFPGNLRASTARDFIPNYLKDGTDQPIIIDIAEAIFGFVRSDKYPEPVQQSCASRVFVSDGVLTPHQEKKVQKSLDNEPQSILLSSPKPTTFQHYLVQTSDEKSKLKHYASQPYNGQIGETVIRGHKLYWHKPYQEIEVPADSETQTSLVKPIDPEIEFTFTIYFENLSDVELGSLLWVLSLSSDKSEQMKTGQDNEKYCFSLGMGKPLGMGEVKIEYDLHLSDRVQRYHHLFNGDEWSENEKDDVAQKEINCVREFEKYVLDRISQNDYPENKNRQQIHHLREIPRIEMLLAMLECNPPKEGTDYMSLEDFKHRKVLPTPLDIRDIQDNRRFSVKNLSSQSTKPKLRKKTDKSTQETNNNNLALQRPSKSSKPKP